MNKLLAKIIKNNNALGSCDVHDFSIDLTPEKMIGKRWQCSKCSGEIDGGDKYWYEIGLKHGGKLL